MESPNPESGDLLNVPVALPLLYGKMTLEDALDEEDNMFLPLSYSSRREDFFF